MAKRKVPVGNSSEETIELDFEPRAPRDVDLSADLICALSSNPKIMTGGPQDPATVVKIARQILLEMAEALAESSVGNP